MEIQTLLLFVVASLSINLIPGQDVVYIVSNTMAGKLKMGLRAATGLGVGYFVHTFAAVFGLSAIIVNSAVAFMAVKYLGAAYLLYLGICALRNFFSGNSKINIRASDAGNNINVFKQGVMVAVLNPKVALFFLSFLPQFIDPTAASPEYQLLVLGVVFCITATLCNLAYAIVGSWLFSSAKSQRFSRVIEGTSGVLLIGLAGKIALSRE
ncbi:lysine transporter LysE [Grimontia sp. AD028]|uniref:LysE family translocator n=1 Tax=Grimontia sp. AD028 TaxID=1581149 RepID=UPI00061B092E|nr:LysE family translocator [Grimontia sp. AD028]KKD60485.1 lysine transporter LysE [Grimontia sp. AD028]